MRKFLTGLILAAAGVSMTACASSDIADKASSLNLIDARAAQVEMSLLPAIVVRGETYEDYTISKRLARYGAPNASVAVIDGGEVVLARSWGENADAETLFQAASLSKAISAAGMTAFALDKGIDLDADLTPLMKSVDIASINPGGTPVTLRGLLSHMAGATVGGFEGYARDGEIPSNLEVVKGSPRTNSEPVRIDPDPKSRFRYAGGGYQLAQAFIEEVSGRPFAAVMKEYVLGPAGMTRSTFDQPLPPERTSEATFGYRRDGSPIAGGGWNVYPEQAAAGLWTTPEEYARFIVALMKAKDGDASGGISPAVARELLSETGDEYRLGIVLTGDGKEERLEHLGGNEGFRTGFLAMPQLKQGVVVMANSDVGLPIVFEITRAADAVYGWGVRTPREVELYALSPEALQVFAGAYALPDDAPGDAPYMVLTPENGRLRGSNREGAFFTLTPIGPDLFVDQEDDAELQFISTSTGMTLQVGDAALRKIEGS